MISQERLDRYLSSPAEFRADLLIDRSGSSVKLGSVMDDWQRADFLATDPGWRQVIGKGGGAKLRAYLERPRGHSKTADLACMVTWALSMCPTRISGVAAAGDREQAKLLRTSIDKLCHLNRWLAKLLDVQAAKVINRHTGSELSVISSDVHTSWGVLADFIVIDEVGNWADSGEGLLHSLVSAAAKRTNCFLCLISNAGCGEGDSWQWRFMDRARQDQRWHFSRLNGPVASWITEETLAEQRRLLPTAVYDRLWGNQWTSGVGDALSKEDIDAAFERDLHQLDSAEKGFVFCGGLDIGISKDFSSFVVVGKDKHSRYRVARCWVWRPPQGGKIDLETVEETIADASRAFKLRKVAADPYQAEFLVSRLKKRRVKIETRPQSGKALVEQCMCLLENFTSSNIDCCRHPQLEHDIRHLRVEEKSYGMRLVSDRTSAGHGDVASALSICLATLKSMKRRALIGLGRREPAPRPKGLLSTSRQSGALSQHVKDEEQKYLESLSIQELERLGFRRKPKPVPDDEPAVKFPWTQH